MFEVPAEMTLREKLFFLQSQERLVEIFGPELVQEKLMEVPTKKLVGIYHSEQKREPANSVYLGQEMNYVTSYVTVGGKEFSRTDRVNCHHWLVPNPIQHIEIAPHLIRPCLLQKWPWLSEFVLDVYWALDEIYVRLEWSVHGHRNLYVPYDAMVRENPALIVDRMESYFKWYTRGKLGWDNFKNDPEVVKFMEAFNANLGTR